MSNSVSESHFYMWRALFALVHVDNEVHDQEVRFMAEALEDNPFSDAQRTILNNDMHEAKDIKEMFIRVKDAKDQAMFFKYARDVVWADGSFGEHEQQIMLELQKLHMQGTNLDDLVGNVDLEIEGADQQQRKTQRASADDVEIEHFSFGRWLKNLFKKS